MNRKLYLSLFLIICLYDFCFGQIYGYLIVFVEGPVKLLVQDSEGRRTGFDPSNNQYFNDIPNIVCGPAGTGSEIDGEPSIEGWDFTFSKSINFQFEENYKMKILGNKKGSYYISAGMSQTKRNGKDFNFVGNIDSLQVIEYEFFYTTDTTKTLYFRECQTSVTN